MTEQRLSRPAGSPVPIASRNSRSGGTTSLARRVSVADENLSLEAPRAKSCSVCHERYPADFRVCPRDATRLDDAPEQDSDVDPFIGVVLGESYEIVRSIGEGGMGRVYEARHKRLTGKRFAVKVLHADLARQPEVVSRFLREAEATSVLHHANIVDVVDVNRGPDGRPYIVAELLEGEQLGDHLERVGKLSVPVAIRICRQICSALSAAHAQNIVHRDIKPENVFLVGSPSERERRAKVLDFGISRVGEVSGTLTKTGMVMGTPAYMPPEQARGQRVDHRADIYSVGVILYQAVTGTRPFEGLDPMSTLAAVLSDEPKRPCTLDATLPPALELVIQKAMAKLPADRYNSMRELDAELAFFEDAMSGSRFSRAPLPSLRSAVAANDTVNTVGVLGKSRSAQRARGSLVALSLVTACCALAGLADAATSTIRWMRGGGTLSLTEIVLAVLGAICLLIAPGIAWTRYVTDRVWPSTPRAVYALSRVKNVLIASLVAYGVTSLSVRVLESIARADVHGVAWPGWAVLNFGVAVASGAGVWLSDELRERARIAKSQSSSR
jgi:serine/threonine-protein kinase